MKKTVKEAWVKALRSGRYKQANSRLEYNGRFCCLGVLCKTLRMPIDDARHPLATEFLNDAVLQKVGLANHEQITLSTMNDSGFSFEAIADYIHVNL